MSPVVCVAGGERLITGVVRARRGGGGLAATTGHSGVYAMREKILRKLIWHDGMILRRGVQRYGLTEKCIDVTMRRVVLLPV